MWWKKTLHVLGTVSPSCGIIHEIWWITWKWSNKLNAINDTRSFNLFSIKTARTFMLIKTMIEAIRPDVKINQKHGPMEQLTTNNFSCLGWMPFNYEREYEIGKFAGIFVIFRLYVIDFSRDVWWNQFPLGVLCRTTGCNNSSFTMIVDLLIIVHPRSKNHWTILLIIGP